LLILHPLLNLAATAAPPEALDIACADLVDPDAVYAFNPNLALLDTWTPDAGTAAADAIDADGVACRWVFESGGGSMDVSVARLSEDRITELKNDAFASSTMVPTYSADEGYFEVEDGAGTEGDDQGEPEGQSDVGRSGRHPVILGGGVWEAGRPRRTSGLVGEEGQGPTAV
jgi:hypothetical protein